MNVISRDYYRRIAGSFSRIGDVHTMEGNICEPHIKKAACLERKAA
jgi:hypothetical protein